MCPGSNQYISFLLDRTRATCRQEGYSRNTQERYLYWVRRFLDDFEIAAPGDLQAASAQVFLNNLSGVSHSTKNQARNALRFFFGEVPVGPIGEESEWDALRQVRALPDPKAVMAEADRSFSRSGRASSPQLLRKEVLAQWGTGVRGHARH